MVQVGRFLWALQELGEGGAGLAAVSMAGPDVVCLLAPGVLAVALYIAAFAACSVASLLPATGRPEA
jgi:hypothetical protein